MKTARMKAFLAIVSLAAVSCAKPATPTPAPSPAPAPTAGGQQAGRAGAPPQTATMPDSIAQQNDAYVAQLTAQIAGKENLPAEQVFKDIQVLKGTPAGRMLAIMNSGYSRGLGVSCRNCHDVTAWESNARPAKTEARGMIKMVNMINEGNKSIPEFGDSPPVVNCTVCHRGSRRPVRNLPGQGGAPNRGGAPGGAGQPPVRTID